MAEFWFIFKELYKGESLLRAYLNLRLKRELLIGDTIDIGGGSGREYLTSVSRGTAVNLCILDIKSGDEIDFETDRLPAVDNKYDTVLFLNVMEHIFNYQHIANEVVRITKPEGKLIGYVPFLMWYHPDHSDFFRYTHEAIQKIFSEAGATHVKVEPIAPGLFTAGLHMYIHLFPRIIRPVIFFPHFILDKMHSKLKPSAVGRHALGYFFIVQKGIIN